MSYVKTKIANDRNSRVVHDYMREDPLKRPKMRKIVSTLSQLVMSSIEWEASLGGNNPMSQVRL